MWWSPHPWRYPRKDWTWHSVDSIILEVLSNRNDFGILWISEQKVHLKLDSLPFPTRMEIEKGSDFYPDNATKFLRD